MDRVTGLLVSFVASANLLLGQTWRSELYPENWRPPGPAISFETDKLIQDFSRAGYRSGEEPIPQVDGPLFDVSQSPFNADPSGASDSTEAIQSAINAAGFSGGGVVYLPSGLYRVSPQLGQSHALKIDQDNIILRGAGIGQTRILNTSVAMRGTPVILMQGEPNASLYQSGDASSLITSDLLGPTVRIPVADSSLFPVGTRILIRSDITDAWINEHNEPGWLGLGANLRGMSYPRVVVEVDEVSDELIVDIPTRYYLKQRDNARVIREGTSPLTGCALEEFSIGNVENLAEGWGDNDFLFEGTAGYEAHACYLVRIDRARDCWMQSVGSFRFSGNTLDAHMLSSGVNIIDSSRITLRETHFQRAQYGGNGGNGYMYRIERSADCLLDRCKATHSRHGFLVSHMASTGNVLLRCEDREGGRQVGNTGGYNRTAGSGSDHHMHFSHSNLVDTCFAEDSHWEANYRPFGTEPKHNISAAHCIFWNTRGEGLDARNANNAIVRSNQARYGYVIGTRGSRPGVKTEDDFPDQTRPIDHLEGEGMGDQLEPFSLYEDQRARSLPVLQIDPFAIQALRFPSNSLRLEPQVFLSQEPIAAGFTTQWSLSSGPAEVSFSGSEGAAITATFSERGDYDLRVSVTDGMTSAFEIITVQVKPQNPPISEATQIVIEPSVDAYLRGGSNSDTSYGDKNALVLGYKGPGDKSTYRSLVRFDLTELAGEAISSAWVEFRGSRDFDASVAPNAVLELIENDSWPETVTWDSQPEIGAQLASFPLSLDGVENIDITNVVAAEAEEDQAISLLFRLVGPGDVSNTFRYGSKEQTNRDLRPKIVATIGTAHVTFEDWTESFSLGGSGPNEDFDGDGIPNYAEYILNMDPLVTDGPAMTFEGTLPELSLVFGLSETLPSTAGLVLEESETLSGSSWSPVPSVGFERNQSGEMVAELPSEAPSKSRFYRLRFY